MTLPWYTIQQFYIETHFYESEEFERMCNAKHHNPGYLLQSFGCAKWISPAIPCTGPLADLVIFLV
jgi:hypothetical protein